MIARCTDSNNIRWERYGGKGITVCERWRVYDNFVSDVGERPPGCTLDRYPNRLGNYEPGNVRWATHQQQMRNTSRNRQITVNGVTQPLAAWIEIAEAASGTIEKRLEHGWSESEAVTVPPLKVGQRLTGHHWLTVRGEKRTLAEWSRIKGIAVGTIEGRLRKGLSEEEAVLNPVLGRFGKPKIPSLPLMSR